VASLPVPAYMKRSGDKASQGLTGESDVGGSKGNNNWNVASVVPGVLPDDAIVIHRSDQQVWHTLFGRSPSQKRKGCRMAFSDLHTPRTSE